MGSLAKAVNFVAANMAMRARKSRFQVAPKADRTIDGITFDSKKEAKRYAELKWLERAGQITDLKLQPSWTVEINGKKLTTYTADFSYRVRSTTRLIVEDTKSSGTAKDAAYRLRKKAAELAHGIMVDEVIL